MNPKERMARNIIVSLIDDYLAIEAQELTTEIREEMVWHKRRLASRLPS